jgi:hypothetical protein
VAGRQGAEEEPGGRGRTAGTPRGSGASGKNAPCVGPEKPSPPGLARRPKAALIQGNGAVFLEVHGRWAVPGPTVVRCTAAGRKGVGGEGPAFLTGPRLRRRRTASAWCRGGRGESKLPHNRGWLAACGSENVERLTGLKNAFSGLARPFYLAGTLPAGRSWPRRFRGIRSSKGRRAWAQGSGEPFALAQQAFSFWRQRGRQRARTGGCFTGQGGWRQGVGPRLKGP